jgi:heme-degrading monooxygenase HmoA
VNKPQPPYYAVIFTSLRTAEDEAGYEKMAARMLEQAAEQPGFLGIESARGHDGVGLTVSYWASREVIRSWREHVEHRVAQQWGKEKWYEWFRLRICRVEAEWDFQRDK